MPQETPTVYTDEHARNAAARLNDPTPQSWLERVFPSAASANARERRAEIGDKARRFGKNVLKVVAIVGIPSVVGFNLYLGYDLATNSDHEPYFGPLNDKVAAVSIHDDARFREMPAVSDNGDLGTNTIEQIDIPEGATITIETPEGIYIDKDEYNGDWFGIRIEDLPQGLADAASASGDKDGVVWVNTQTADLVMDPEQE